MFKALTRYTSFGPPELGVTSIKHCPPAADVARGRAMRSIRAATNGKQRRICTLLPVAEVAGLSLSQVGDPEGGRRLSSCGAGVGERDGLGLLRNLVRNTS